MGRNFSSQFNDSASFIINETAAKFFDIEYQTYGWVHSTKRKPDDEAQFHWKHEDDTKCITIAFDRNTNQFLGINTFRIRMRHEVFDRWLTERRTIDYVISHLSEANFDPEFYKHYEQNIQNAYKNQLQMV